MKKFFTLFALLSLAMSASADVILPPAQEGKVSIFYEVVEKDYKWIYVYGGAGQLAGGWWGSEMQEIGETADHHKIYLWTHDGNDVAEKIIFHKDGTDYNRVETNFVANGYYIDGVLDHVTEPEDGGYTVYFYDSKSWGNNLHIYVWHNTYEINNGWPGKAMTSLGNNLYSYEIKGTNFTNILFNNGTGGGANQTADLTAINDKVYVIDGTTNGEGSHNTFTVDANLQLTDGEDFPYNKDFAVLEASYSRNFVNNWGTLCLPFAISSIPNGVTFYELSSVNASQKTLTFSSISAPIAAGQPVVFKVGDGVALNISETNANVSPSITPVEDQTSGWILNGSYSEQRVTGTNLYYIAGNQFWLSNDYIDIPAYRAWFSGTAMTSSGEAPFRITTDDTEDIQFVEQEDGTVKAYFDLQGRKLDGGRKGLVIENGKIIMVK